MNQAFATQEQQVGRATGPGANKDEAHTRHTRQDSCVHVLSDETACERAQSAGQDQGRGRCRKYQPLGLGIFRREQERRELSLVAELGQELRAEDGYQALQIHRAASYLGAPSSQPSGSR